MLVNLSRNEVCEEKLILKKMRLHECPINELIIGPQKIILKNEAS